MRYLLLQCCIILISFTFTVQAQMRGIWVVSGDLTTRQQVLSCLADCAELGITDVFLQVRTAGNAGYFSATEPRARKIKERGLDVLQLACDQGHDLGLRIHAWINVNYCAPGPGLPSSSKHIANRNPHWVACGRDGRSMTRYSKRELKNIDSEGLYLSPDAPGFAQYMGEVTAEILYSYPVDGIHLDFIRYANWRFDYNGKKADDFIESFGINPSVFGYEKLQAAQLLDGSRLSLWKNIMMLRWMTLRADALTESVRTIRKAQVVARPDAVITAAVWFPSTWAYSYVGQDWMRWVDEDLVDVAFPMAYSRKDAPIRQYLEKASMLLADERVAIGLGAWRIGYESIESKLELARTAEAGWVLFDYGSFKRRADVMQSTKKYIDENYDVMNSKVKSVPRGWQRGWAKRHYMMPVSGIEMERVNGYAGNAQTGYGYSEEALRLLRSAYCAWGKTNRLPSRDRLVGDILPWIDAINGNLPRLEEEDLRRYFKEHSWEYLPSKRRKERLGDYELERIFQMNRNRIYHDMIIDEVRREIVSQKSSNES